MFLFRYTGMIILKQSVHLESCMNTSMHQLHGDVEINGRHLHLIMITKNKQTNTNQYLSYKGSLEGT